MNDSISNTKAGIYIHIPFCTVKCGYCDYYTITNRENDIPEFIQSLITEIKLVSADFDYNWNFDTIFIGGGTPSLLKPQWIDKILNTLNNCFDISDEAEITMEVNPGETPLECLIEYHKASVNRLSIGFQSFNSKLLQFLDRIHSPEDCLTIFRNAREIGFENINIDLLFNIPGQSLKRWKQDLQVIIDFQPEHISLYSLTIEPGTPLQKEVQNGTIIMPPQNTDIAMYELALQFLQDNGYDQYEISSFSLNGKKCRHNLHYWKLDPYLGFGPSAHGYDGAIRSWNSPSLDTYIQQLNGGLLPVGGKETLSRVDQFNELIFNGLKLIEGITLDMLKEKYPQNQFNEYLGKYLSNWKELKIESGVLNLSSKSLFLADTIASDMFIQ